MINRRHTQILKGLEKQSKSILKSEQKSRDFFC